MTFGTYGSKYETHGKQGKVEIAKAIRADLKFAQALPASNPMNLPKGIKVSVRCQFYAGGSSLHLYITAFPGGILNPAALLSDLVRPNFGHELPRYTREAARCLAVLERIAGQYNFDKSDIQSDYFHVNFYVHVGFRHELETESRNALIENGDFAALREDVKVTLAAGQVGPALAQIESQNLGYAAHHYEHAALRELFAHGTAVDAQTDRLAELRAQIEQLKADNARLAAA